jgi:hypothetical protein
MPDRDQVIKGLECCIDQGANEEFDCRKCPYYVSSARLACWINLQIDAVELLKEQEPLVVSDPGAICPNCKWPLYPEDHPRYCGNCGREVLWNE